MKFFPELFGRKPSEKPTQTVESSPEVIERGIPFNPFVNVKGDETELHALRRLRSNGVNLGILKTYAAPQDPQAVDGPWSAVADFTFDNREPGQSLVIEAEVEGKKYTANRGTLDSSGQKIVYDKWWDVTNVEPESRNSYIASARGNPLPVPKDKLKELTIKVK